MSCPLIILTAMVWPSLHRARGGSCARNFALARQNFWQAALSAAKLPRIVGAETSQDFAACGDTPPEARNSISAARCWLLAALITLFLAGGIGKSSANF